MNALGANAFLSSDWSEASNFVLVLVLLLILMILRPRPNTKRRAPPALLELAATRPDEVVSVIVQKAITDSNLEEWVARLGGTVTRDLPIINAFAAELPAQVVLKLAKAEGVRWVSLDAPVTCANLPFPPDDKHLLPGWDEIAPDLGHSRNPQASHSVHNRG